MFAASESKVIDLSKKTLSGDSAGFIAAFDKNYYTTYSSNNANCELVIDIGADWGLSMTKIRYFPTTTWNVASTMLSGATFTASNDNSVWTPIG